MAAARILQLLEKRGETRKAEGWLRESKRILRIKRGGRGPMSQDLHMSKDLYKSTASSPTPRLRNFHFVSDHERSSHT